MKNGQVILNNYSIKSGNDISKLKPSRNDKNHVKNQYILSEN